MKIVVPSRGVESWRELLRDPSTQWRDGYSAKELARSWESAAGFPATVAALFRSSGIAALREAEPLLAIPEHRVDLPGGNAASQSDLFVLAVGDGQLIAIAVEGKVDEPFAEPLSTWLQDASAGKIERLEYVKSCLGLSGDLPGELRYQLLHRAASAVIEAQRFCASIAVLVVHSFSTAKTSSLADFERFLLAFGAHFQEGQLARLGDPRGTQLFAGWAQGDPASGALDRAARAR